MRKRLVGALTLTTFAMTLLAIVSACSQEPSAPPKPSYSADLNELKQRFNADKGKVRLLLILSPT